MKQNNVFWLLKVILKIGDSVPLKAVHTTEKMGADTSRNEYGPHIFSRVDYAYHVFGDWPRVFSGFGAIDVYGPKT